MLKEVTKKELLEELSEHLETFKKEEYSEELTQKLNKEISESVETFIKRSGESELSVCKVYAAIVTLRKLWEKRISDFYEMVKKKEYDAVGKDILDDDKIWDWYVSPIYMSYIRLFEVSESMNGLKRMAYMSDPESISLETKAGFEIPDLEERKKFWEENKDDVNLLDLWGPIPWEEVIGTKELAVTLEKIMCQTAN